MSSPDINTSFAHDVLAVLREAGTEIMDIYNTKDHAVVEFKDDNSPLTQADTQSHDVIVDRLARLTPRIPIVSEEDKVESATDDRYWLVDPLDGTKEFIKRNGEFTVMAALMHNERPVFGAIHAPDKQIDYYGGVGLEPVRIANNHQQKISVSSALNQPLVVVASRSHQDNKSQAFMQQLGDFELTSMGSGFKFGLVAEGRADIYVRFHPTMEWDTAAGQAILEAAGGTMVGVDGSEFRYGKKGRKNGGFIAANPLLDIPSLLEKTT